MANVGVLPDMQAVHDALSAAGGTGVVRREICPNCQQSIVAGSRRLGAPNRHDCVQLEATAKEFLLMYPCIRCGDIFTGISAMGSWECRRHTGKYSEEHGYSCCGRKKIQCNNPAVHNMVWARQGRCHPNPFEPQGCTPCDHYNPKAPNSVDTTWRSVDVQRDLPQNVLAAMLPAVADRPGFKVLQNAQGQNIAVLRGAGESPVEKSGSG